MTTLEKAMRLLEDEPARKMDCVIAYIQGIIAGSQETPNDSTLEAIAELENGNENEFDGSTHDFIKMMLEN